MSNQNLSVRFMRSLNTPDSYFAGEMRRVEYDLAMGLWDKLNTDEWHTVRVVRETSPAGSMMQEYTTTVSIGKVTPVFMAWKMPEKLNWKERLRALFTGEVPVVLREK